MGDWGTILNAFLQVAHNIDGTLQATAINSAGGVTSVNGHAPTSGTVTLTASDVGAVSSAAVGIANGVASLNGSSRIPTNQLGSGSPDSTVFLRGDGVWTTPSGSGGGTLSSNIDVAVPSPTDGDVLTYNSTDAKWENKTAPVTRVFGRTGAIVAQSGDYTAAQVGAFANTVDLSTIASANSTSGNVSMSSHRLTNVADPTNAQDAATKNYVDSTAQGLDPKQSVAAATAAVLPANSYSNGTSGVGATLTASGPGALSIDGYSVQTNDRLLIQNEAAASHNGIYVATNSGGVSTSYVLTRSSDFDLPAQVPGAYVFAENGTVNGDCGFVCTTTGTVTLGTTAITWTQFSGAGEITAGTGLTKSGNTLSLTTPVAIANGGTGQNSQQSAINALTGTQASGKYLRSDGSNASLSTIQAGDLPGATGSTQGVVRLTGDLGGTASSPVVESIQGVSISGTATSGQALIASSASAATWTNLASAPVASVFGRTGTVTAQSGDYTAAQVSATPALTPTAVQSSSYTANANDLAKFDVSSGSISQNLPNAPADKSLYAAKIVTTASTHTLTLTCQGSDVINLTSGATSYTLSLLDQLVILQYQSTGHIWNVIVDDLPLTQLDARYPLSGAVVPTSGVSPGGLVFVTGLVSDGGVTDNTTALSTAAALLPSSGGTLILPAGKFGCNWTLPTSVTLLGAGSASDAAGSGSGATILCGVNSLSGAQAQVLSLSNTNNRLQCLTVDAGGSGASYSCQAAVVASGNDPSMFDCVIMNGTQVALNISGARANLHMVKTDQQPASFTQRTISGTGGTTASSTTITDSGASFTAADVNRQVAGTGIPLGSWITSVTNSTTAVINQAALSSNSAISITVYQSDNAWLGSLDGTYELCRFRSGTKRINGFASYLTGIHFYFPPATGANGLSNVLLAANCNMDAVHFDTTPDTTGSLLVHLNGGTQSLIGSCIMSESTNSTFAAFTENDTTSSVNFGVVSINETGSNPLQSIVNLAAGPNLKLTMNMVSANTLNLNTTSGVPNVFASSSVSTSAGPITLNYQGSIYGVGQVVTSVLTGASNLALTAAQANTVITASLTQGTWLITGTLTAAIGGASSGDIDAYLTFSGTGTLTGGSADVKPTAASGQASCSITGTLVATTAGTLTLNAYPVSGLTSVTAQRNANAGSGATGVTNIICTRVA